MVARWHLCGKTRGARGGDNRRMTDAAPAVPHITWTDDEGQPQQARWVSLAGHPAPRRVRMVDDELSADAAYKLACEGTGLLWVGDFHNARQLLQALGRRVDAKARRSLQPAADLKQAFHTQRQLQAQRARVLGMLLLPFDPDHGVPLHRAPDVRQAGLDAHGPMETHYVASLRELQGLVGAFEWRKKGVEIPALKARIHPHHGVFSPVRGEYVDLVAQAPLPAACKTAGAFDIGTGTGVLAALLARRGVKPVVATDLDARALACARDNLARLGLGKSVSVVAADLFPPGKAGLIVCNPPWVPAKPSSPLEAAVYDPDSRMLRGWLSGLAAHLAPGGEGWLILSDLAEHLGLRSREELLGWIADAGLRVLGRLDTRPAHRRAADADDPLHAARTAEVTSLWRLGAQPAAKAADGKMPPHA
jgi:methylase of polypeptide subunit release factors